MYDVAVIGAGAAGLAASIFAAEAAAKGDRPQNIVLLDGAKTIGAKILVSGGGRCNVTHDVVTLTDFFGNRHIIKNVLAAFPVQATIVTGLPLWGRPQARRDRQAISGDRQGANYLDRTCRSMSRAGCQHSS